jgi:hypothetical protein
MKRMRIDMKKEDVEKLIEACRIMQMWPVAIALTSLLVERDALKAENLELKNSRDSAARMLHKAGEQFKSYAIQHRTKRTVEGDQKAGTNDQWAQRCFDAYDAATKEEPQVPPQPSALLRKPGGRLS